MHSGGHEKMHYVHFAVMLGLSFVIMFAFMCAMVDKLANVYPNLNRAYMAGLMIAPMAVFELALISVMYPGQETEPDHRSVQFSPSAYLLVRNSRSIRRK